jgi:energy-coupling factor transporter transmembrane protein EcfT
MSRSLRHLDPRAKILLWLAVATSGVVLPAGYVLHCLALALLAVAAPTAGCLRTTVGFVIKVVLPTMVMLLVVYGFLVPPGESTRALLFGLQGRLALGLQTSLGVGARLVVIGAATLAFVGITPQMQFAAGLRAMGLAPPMIAVFVSSYNMYGVAVRKIRQIADAQRSRGLGGDGFLLSKLRMYIPILRPLVFSLLLGAIERAALWRSRNYLDSVGAHDLRFHRGDIALIAVAVAVLFGSGLIRWAS